MPTSSSLVTNLPADFNTFGQAVDTSMAQLKGGTTGQVLKKTSGTDLDVEWGTASSGLTLINTTSFSAVASQSFNSVFSATYDNYRIIYVGTSTVQNAINLRLRVSGTDNSSSNYNSQRISGSSTTVAGLRQTAQTSASIGVITDNQSIVTIDIANPFLSVRTPLNSQSCSSSTANIEYFSHVAFHAVDSSFDGFTFSVASGTMTGTVTIYGFAK